MTELGQLFILGISGKKLTEEEGHFLEQENIGGVIFFKHNYESPAQIAELVNSIQEKRQEDPLFISLDHEGGRVIRFGPPFTQFPAMNKVGLINSPKLTFEIYQLMAQELKTVGVNLNFAPCCDILHSNTHSAIGDRAFSGDHETVSKHITAAIRGLQANGIIACAKHFPGHGLSSKDSHFDLPIIKTSLEQLLEVETRPFCKASKARVEMIMMAHLIVDAIDERLPTSLSDKAYEFLRKTTKFQKIIVSDDMEMKAITEHYGIENAPVMCLNAGADLLCYRNFEVGKSAYLAVKKAVKEKIIPLEKITDKLKRIYLCKKEYLSDYTPIDIPAIQNMIGTLNSKNLMDELNEKVGLLGAP